MEQQLSFNVFQKICKRKCSFKDNWIGMDTCKKRKLLFEQGDFESAFYLSIATNKFILLKTQEMSHEKQMQPESKVNFTGEIFTGIEIMNSSVKSSALTEESLILY